MYVVKNFDNILFCFNFNVIDYQNELLHSQTNMSLVTNHYTNNNDNSNKYLYKGFL